jgi:hypothetical protein
MHIPAEASGLADVASTLIYGKWQSEIVKLSGGMAHLAMKCF